jgi:hypothetical protein
MNKVFTKAISLEKINTTISAMPKGKMPAKRRLSNTNLPGELGASGAHTLQNIQGNLTLEIKINGEIGATFNLHR